MKVLLPLTFKLYIATLRLLVAWSFSYENADIENKELTKVFLEVRI